MKQTVWGDVKEVRNGEWRKHAECRDMPSATVTMFSFGRTAIDVAKMMCSRCPVRVECLEYAVSNKENHGVWGGASEDERFEIRMGRLDKVKLFVNDEWQFVKAWEQS